MLTYDQYAWKLVKTARSILEDMIADKNANIEKFLGIFEINYALLKSIILACITLSVSLIIEYVKSLSPKWINTIYYLYCLY